MPPTAVPSQQLVLVLALVLVLVLMLVLVLVRVRVRVRPVVRLVACRRQRREWTSPLC